VEVGIALPIALGRYELRKLSTVMEEVRLLDPNEELTLADIGTGRVELLLKCTSGLYKGRFLYINTSVNSIQPEGESFGSDMSADAGLTTYIEKAGLSPRHAEIKFLEDSYILRDCGSTTGTWVKLGAQEGSREVVKEGSALQFGNSVVEFSRGPQFDGIAEAVELYRLQDLAASLDNFDSIAYIQMDSVPVETRPRLASAQETIRSRCPKYFLKASTSFESQAVVGLKPVKVGSASDCEIRISGIDRHTARIVFDQGQFALSREPGAKTPIFKRLEGSEAYTLQPGHVFRIGQLEFEVCRFNVGRWSERGARPTLEDTDVSLQNLFVYDEIPVSYFAVYDGHGGQSCSEYLQANLHSFIRSQLISHPLKVSEVNRALHEGIEEAFKTCDLAFYAQNPSTAETHGATGISCLIIGDRIITCNLGDSKAVLSRRGRAIELSTDHKPDNPAERARIQQNGGFVAFGRVCGRLAVSRSFGDFIYKSTGEDSQVFENTAPCLEVTPEIKEIYINPQEDEFLLLACDGMFEAFTPQKAVTLIRDKLSRMHLTEQDPSRVIREVVNEAVSSRRTRDNVTAILVTLSCGIALDSINLGEFK
jgi:protein phosphatase 2C family protein 2/3